MLADVAPPPPLVESSTRFSFGLANPEWLLVGLDHRTGHWGGTLGAGTLMLASNLHGSLRYYWTERAGGPFLEAGASFLRLSSISDETPRDWKTMAFLGAGYQWVFGRFSTTLGLGFSPFPVPDSTFQSLFVSSARSLPRALLQFGYAL
ncbi:MAG: hypothetical protein ACM3YO_09320 [Bacteroidota bacterium]